MQQGEPPLIAQCCASPGAVHARLRDDLVLADRCDKSRAHPPLLHHSTPLTHSLTPTSASCVHPHPHVFTHPPTPFLPPPPLTHPPTLRSLLNPSPPASGRQDPAAGSPSTFAARGPGGISASRGRGAGREGVGDRCRWRGG